MPGARATVKKPGLRKAKKVTAADLRANMRELQELHKETEKAHKETEKAHKETEKTLDEFIAETRKSAAETRKSIDETRKSIDETRKAIGETRKAIGETNRAINGLSSTVGSLVERMMTPDLPRKFRQFGFNFNRVSTIKYAVEGSIYTQIDGMVENGDQAMVVEVKTTLRHEDIDEHLERMDKVRAYSDEHGDKREFLGAMAAMVISESVRKYALKKGFFIIEPSGEDVKVTPPLTEARRW